MRNTVTIRTNESLQDWDKKMCRRYKYSGDGYAWETKQSFSNYLFFHGLKIESVRTMWSKFRQITISGDLPSYGSNKKLMDFSEYSKYDNYNEILTLQNGDYVIQKQLLNSDLKNISLFSGWHKKHDLVVDYRTAENILKRVNFKKVIQRHTAAKNEIVIMEFLGTKEIMIKKTILTVDADDLSIEDQKAMIRAYNDKYKDSVIMFNSGICFIFKKAAGA